MCPDLGGRLFFSLCTCVLLRLRFLFLLFRVSLLFLLGSVPYTLGQLPNLQLLGLGYNNFGGAIPNSLCQATTLTFFQVDSNANIKCFPDCLTSITTHIFDVVAASGCPSDGEQGLCSLIAATNVQSLVSHTDWACDTNGYAMTDPCLWAAGIVCSGSLEVVSISLCTIGLMGTIPDNIGLISTLTQLRFQENSLHGPLPSSIGLLSNLAKLVLFSNSLSGALPNSIGYLTAISYLDIHGNSFTDSLPGTLDQLTALSVLLLGNNGFIGPLPTIGATLQVFHAYNNAFTGTFLTLTFVALLTFATMS